MNRNRLFTTLFSALTLTFCTSIIAAPPAPAAPGDDASAAIKPELADEALAKGTIMSVNPDKHEFVLKTESDREVTVKYNESTTFWVDGKEVEAADALKADFIAKVLHKRGMAMKVEILK